MYATNRIFFLCLCYYQDKVCITKYMRKLAELFFLVDDCITRGQPKLSEI